MGQKRVRCASPKRDGRPCTRWARPGSRRCRQHDGDGGGRQPEALNSGQRAQLIALVRTGVTLDVAIGVTGVARRTVYNWIERGREDGAADEYATFAADLDAARDHGEADLVRLVRDAANDDPRVAMWLLERLAPERFARPSVRAPRRAPKLDEGELPDNVVELRSDPNAAADW